MQAVSLKELAEIQVGYQSRAGIKDNPSGTHRLIQGKDFVSPKNLKTSGFIRFNPERRPALYTVRKGDVLFLARGREHFACLIEDELEKTLVSSSFYIIRVKDKNFSASYLAWWLNQFPAQSYFKSRAGGGMFSFVSKTVLSETIVEIPGVSTQQRIIDINRLREKEEMLTERLLQRRKQLVDAVCLRAIKK